MRITCRTTGLWKQGRWGPGAGTTSLCRSLRGTKTARCSSKWGFRRCRVLSPVCSCRAHCTATCHSSMWTVWPSGEVDRTMRCIVPSQASTAISRYTPFCSDLFRETLKPPNFSANSLRHKHYVCSSTFMLAYELSPGAKPRRAPSCYRFIAWFLN